MFVKNRREQANHERFGPNERGQNLAEFAFTMPLLIAILVGVLLLAWIGFSYVSITSAARMGARHMMSYPTEAKDPDRFADVDDEITYVVTSSMALLDWHQAEITIAPQPPEDRLSETQVSIQIIYHVNSPTISIPYVVREGSFVILPPITLQATSRMRLD